MSRMIKFLSIAMILFSAAAGASWYLQYQQHGNDDPAKTPDEINAGAKRAPSSFVQLTTSMGAKVS